MNKENKYNQLLEARRIGINEDDVDNSTDIFQLLRWQIEVSKDVANISSQLEKSKLPDCEVNQAWVQRAVASRDLLNIFIEKINIRVQELRFARTVSLAESFMQVCRQNLDFGAYDKLFKMAKEK